MRIQVIQKDGKVMKIPRKLVYQENPRTTCLLLSSQWILFHCKTCENESSAYWNLGNHIENDIKPETRVFICEKCEIKFPGLRSLTEHLRKVHDLRKLGNSENLRIHTWYFSFNNEPKVWLMWEN